MYAWGQSVGRVDANPAEHASPPGASTPNPRAPEMATVDRILATAAAFDPELLLLVRLGAVTAARRSELVALRWSDFDLDEGLVAIEAGQVVVPGPEKGKPNRVTTSTKTGEGGVLLLDDTTIDMLRQHRRLQVEVARKLDIELPDGYVFAADETTEKAWHPDTLSARMRRLCDKVPGAAGVSLKSLRAFVASELEAQGADLTTAQAVLRHRSAQTTARHYRVAREARVRSATRGLGERLGLPPATQG